MPGQDFTDYYQWHQRLRTHKTDNWTPFELGCRQSHEDAEVARHRKEFLINC